jgi:hypothetical protein
MMMAIAGIILAGSSHFRHVRTFIPAMVSLISSRGKWSAPKQVMDSGEIRVV